MKFPSVKNLAEDALSTFKRFPLEVLFALAGTIAATIYIHSDDTLPYSLYTKLMMTAELGLVLSLAATLYIESLTAGPKYLVRVAVALTACCTFFMYNHQLRGIDGMRFFLLGLAFHLAVSFSAFTAKGQVQGFWQFNKTLFLRFLASILYSMVLYLGLVAAISASNFLFNLHIEYKVYGIVYAWILGVFNTVFFLAGVPAKLTELESDDTYPKGLKVFTQYVLIPLASVYVVILLAYEVKLLIQWRLPKGLVSDLILGYAVFGILSILLIYPLRNRDGNTWIKTYARSFYFLLVPLLVLLFLAVLSRVMPYGVTPYRYFLLVLAGWLTFITFYFLLSRKQSIKVIPASLCIITLLTIWGPQSAFSVSETSQRTLLIKIFNKYGAYEGGKLRPLSGQKLSKKDGEEAMEKVRYFVNDMDISSLQPLMNQNIAKAVDSIHRKLNVYYKNEGINYSGVSEYELRSQELNWAADQLGLRKFNQNFSIEINNYVFQNEDRGVTVTKGYDYFLNIGNAYQDTATIKVKDAALKITRKMQAQVYSLKLNNETVTFDIKQIADSLLKSKKTLKAFVADNSAGEYLYILPGRMLSFTHQTEHYSVTLQIDNLRATNADYGDNIEGSYLVKVLK